MLQSKTGGKSGTLIHIEASSASGFFGAVFYRWVKIQCKNKIKIANIKLTPTLLKAKCNLSTAQLSQNSNVR